jgi:hypothetical protein
MKKMKRKKTPLGATHKRVLIGIGKDGSYKFKDIPIKRPAREGFHFSKRLRIPFC